VAQKRRIKYRSKFEAEVAPLIEKYVPLQYEADVLQYIVPKRTGNYHPDFKIAPKTYIETKGKWVVEDRKKHLLLKEQLEPLGYKFYLVFYNANQRLSKKSKTTYGEWATKHGIEWSHRVPKKEWFNNESTKLRGPKSVGSGTNARGRRKGNN
jgi:hypothetical protein